MRSVRIAAARGLSACAGVACALALASCGGSPDPSVNQGLGPGGLGVPLRQATCTDWQQADVEGRLATIAELRSIVGGQITGGGVSGRGTVLGDEQAYDLFEARCDEPYARGFLLYKLYSIVADFAGVAP